MRIVVIVDGLEATRQVYSDNGQEILQACLEVDAGDQGLQVEIVRDTDVEGLLASLAASDISALFFASNALRHPSGLVSQAVHRHQEQLIEFLKMGNGLAVLHQFGEHVERIKLPDNQEIGFVRATGAILPLAPDADSIQADPLLNFPIDIRDIDEGLAAQGQLGRTVSWVTVDTALFPSGIPVVSASAGLPLIVRSPTTVDWRVVVCALPLDWHQSHDLLVNIAQFISTGPPRSILWNSDAETEDYLAPVLSQFGTAFAARADQATDRAISSQGPRLDWLLSRPILHLVDAQAFARQTGEIFLDAARAGGVVMTITKTGYSDVVGFSGFVGSRENELAEEFFASFPSDTAQVLRSGDPYPIRNVVVAASYFSSRFPKLRNSWDPANDASLVATMNGILEYPSLTVSTWLMNVQTIVAAGSNTRLVKAAARHLDRLTTDEPAMQALIAGANAALVRGTLVTFLEAVGTIPDSDLDAGLALRLLDWLGFLGPRAQETVSPELVRDAASRLLRAASSVEKDGLWLSIEGTTHVTTGASAAFVLTGDTQFLATVARCLVTLRKSYGVGLRDVSVASVRSRVAQAIAISERAVPFGVDRIAAAMPRADWSSSRDAIASENGQLTRQIRAMSIQNRVFTTTAENQAAAAQLRRPIWALGAAAAWLIATSLLAVVGFLFLQIPQWTSGLTSIVTIPSFGALSIAFLWIAAQMVGYLERFGIVPRWIAKSISSIPQFARANPH